MKQDTLLIVDDNEINRDMLEVIFSDCYPVVKVDNGHTALELIRAYPEQICAVLLDVIMPEMDGLDVLRALARLGLLDRIPVFLVTGDAREEVTLEAYELGVMDVIRKPYISYVVRRRVQSVVELFRSRRALSRKVESQQADLLTQAEKIIELNQGMVEALATAIEFRSEESGDHIQRIHDITEYLFTHTDLGEGMNRETIQEISLAAVMHDVGKIAVPDAILNKPGRLTPEEFEIMKGHTVQGARLLEQIPQLRESESFHYAWDIARHHHERWDGNGYPDGLKGDEISIWAQVVSLADVYDALRRKRVYKDAFPRQQVLEMIRTGQCGAFNPKLLDRFFAVESDLCRLYRNGEKGDECHGT